VGVTDEQIRALTFYERSPLFNDREKAVILHAERLTRGSAAVRDATVQELRKHFSDDQIVELTLVVCVANFTNRFNDGLRLEPDLG
jgi:alkylhydroperoxidase family enzyme